MKKTSLSTTLQPPSLRRAPLLPGLNNTAMRAWYISLPQALARAIQGAQLIRYSTGAVIAGFMATQLGAAAGDWGALFGTLGPAVTQAQADAIVERARVAR